MHETRAGCVRLGRSDSGVTQTSVVSRVTVVGLNGLEHLRYHHHSNWWEVQCTLNNLRWSGVRNGIQKN